MKNDNLYQVLNELGAIDMSEEKFNEYRSTVLGAMQLAEIIATYNDANTLEKFLTVLLYKEEVNRLEGGRLEKALDKACSKLSELTKNANMPELGVYSVAYSKEAWKDWSLKDE